MPLREDICWDIRNIFPANGIRTLNVREFDLLEPQDFKARLIRTLMLASLVPLMRFPLSHMLGTCVVTALQWLLLYGPRGKELSPLDHAIADH